MDVMVKKIKLKQWALALFLVALPVFANAASLGKLSVFSALGEPLNAEIDVLSTNAQELESLSATLASESVYREQGVERTAVQGTIQASIVKKEDGQVVVKLATDQVVTDNFLDMIITLNWKDGVFLREYTLLLDPSNNALAPTVDVPNAITSNGSETQVAPIQPKASVGKVKRGKSKKVANPVDGIVSKKGDSLTEIAKSLNVQDVNLDQLLLALYKANPSAFVGNNMNRLRVGVTLAMPSAEELSSVSVGEAKQQVRAHAADWHAYASKLADTVAQSAATAHANEQANTGKVTTKADDKTPSPEANSRDVVKLSNSKDVKTEGQQAVAQQDDLAAKENSIKESSERSAELEKQIADMQKLVAIKNKAMANAQANAQPKPSEQKTPQQMVIVPEAQKMNLKLLPVMTAVLSLLAIVLIWVRRKSKEKAADLLRASTAEVVASNAQAANEAPPSKTVDSSAAQASPLNITGINLDFEPVALEEVPVQAAPPIPDAFNGDFSNLLKIQPVKNASEASMPASAEDLPEVDTKIELAAAYVDLNDKRGARVLLKEALRDGSVNQRARAQAMLDKFS